MSVAEKTEANAMLETYRALALVEKEHNLLLLLKSQKENLNLSDDIARHISIVLAEPPNLKQRTDSIGHLWGWSFSKSNELSEVFNYLKNTDKELNNLRKKNEALSEQIDMHRQTPSKKEKLHEAFSKLVTNKALVTVEMDPSYLLYAMPDGSSSGGSDTGTSSSVIIEKLKSAAQTLSSAHIFLAAEAMFGAVFIVSFFVSELYSANKLQKRLDALNLQKTVSGIRLEKSILVGTLFFMRTAVLGISIGLTAVALTTPVGAATLLMVALVTYAIEEFGHLTIERKKLKEALNEKYALETEVKSLIDKNSNEKLPVAEHLKLIDELQKKREALGKVEVAVAILEEKVAASVSRRNRTVYNVIGASLIIISPFFPPLFFVGASMLAIPVVIGAARYADEKWNQGRITQAIINSTIGQSIINSTLYKKMFGDRPSQRQDVGAVVEVAPQERKQEPVKRVELEMDNPPVLHASPIARKGSKIEPSSHKLDTASSPRYPGKKL